MSVLVLTDDEDKTADRVTAELAIRGVPVFRLDQAAIPMGVTMDGRISAGRAWSGQLRSTAGPVIELAEVRAVWHRHTRQFVVDPAMSGPEKAFAYGEARRGYGGVLAALADCLWINDPVAAARAEYKPVQLAAATRAGLRIPDTIITSSPAAAHDWARQLGRPVIYKPLDGVWHADEGQVRVIYTTPVTDIETLLDPALAQTAHMFQEKIDKAYEIRAIFVAGQVFAVRIDAASDQARQDWRSDYDALTYTPVRLPEAVSAALARLHGRLGLVYGAADLACDADGEIVFFETNQAGEWGWLADETGIDVPGALADLMTGQR